MNWKLYMNDNPAINGVGFRAPSPTGRLIHNHYPAEVFFGLNSDKKGRAFVDRAGYIWNLQREKLGQRTFIFDPESNLVDLLQGDFQVSCVNNTFPVLKQDVADFSQATDDLKIRHPLMAKNLDACVISLIKMHDEYIKVFPQYA